MSHNYDSHARSLRPNPTGGDPHIGSSFSEQGRTTLPPLTIAFPTSDSPVTDNYLGHYLSHQHSTPVPYDLHYYASAQQPPQTGYPGYATPTPYQQLSDTRYASGQAYSSPRVSPSSGATDPRRLPPLSVPRNDIWPSAQYCDLPWHTDMQMSGAANDMRSPHFGCSSALTSGHSPFRGTVSTAAGADPHYHQPMRQSERTTTIDPRLLRRLSGTLGPASPILGSEMQHSKELYLPVAAYDAPPTAPHELTPVSSCMQEMPGAGSTDVQPVLGLAISPKRQLTEISGHVVDYGYSHGTKAPDRPPNPRRHRLATSQSHDRIHRTKTSRLPCPDCPKRCGRKQELKRHVFERHDPGKPLECPFCADRRNLCIERLQPDA